MIDILYNEIADKSLPDNPFNTSELKEMTDSFLKKWIKKPEDIIDEAWLDLMSITGSCDRNAFKVGFRAAIKLLMDL